MRLVDKICVRVGIPVAIVLGLLSYHNMKILEPKLLQALQAIEVLKTLPPPTNTKTVQIKMAKDGTCRQYLDPKLGWTEVVELKVIDKPYVNWVTVPSDSFDIQFPSRRSPFPGEEYGSAHGPAAPDPPVPVVVPAREEPYYYTAVTVDNSNCKNAGQMGFIMR